jgi:hypothetical protein
VTAWPSHLPVVFIPSPGRPIEEAVDAGRMAIIGQSKGIEWATPVLFLREPVSFQTASADVPVGSPGRAPPVGRSRVPLHHHRQALVVPKKTHDRLIDRPGCVTGIVPDDVQGIDVYRAALNGLLAGADLSVHILGDTPGDPYDDDPLHTYPIEQLSIALESKRPVMVIIPSDARAKIDKDPAYAAYIESLRSITPTRNSSSWRLWRTRARSPTRWLLSPFQAAKAARATAGAPLSAFVDAHRVDEDFAFQLEKFQPPGDMTRKNLVSPREFDVEIGKFPVYIVVQGHADKDWVSKRFEAAHKDSVNNRARTLVGVYYSVPGSTGKRFRGVFSNPLDPLAEAEALMKQLEGGVE